MKPSCSAAGSRFQGRENIADLQKKNLPLIFIFWHRHILFVIHQFKNTGARPLISLSSDGELVAAVAEEFGMKPIRGSSSKGGARAFLNMVRSVQEENAQVLITADGPKGPARRIKDGTVQLAVKTGAYVIPISWSGSRVKVLEKSWDRFLIPLPFGRIHFAYGQPLRSSTPATRPACSRPRTCWLKSSTSSKNRCKNYDTMPERLIPIPFSWQEKG